MAGRCPALRVRRSEERASIGLQTGLLAERGFAIMVIMVLATTVITPPPLRAVFPAAPPSEEAAIEAAFADPDDPP